jgi:hypothetical protein
MQIAAPFLWARKPLGVEMLAVTGPGSTLTMCSRADMVH